MVKNNLKVSIVMPAKNTAAYLPECIDSILNQTYDNWELVVVNDGSTDQSDEILKSYGQQDTRIRVFDNDKQGIIPALQLTYSKTTGTFITRMDSDDIMPNDKLENMVNHLLQHGKGHIISGQVKYFANVLIGEGYQKYEQWLNNLTASGTNFSELYKECVIASPCWMVYRTDFEKCGAFNSTIYPEDYDLVFRFYKYQLKPIPNSKLLHHWRDYPERTSRNHVHYAYNTFLEIKVHYFLKLNYDSNCPLVIWGAGTKGKKVAELLLANNIPFHWICDNPKKLGKTIYGQKMLGVASLEKMENTQSIITVANPLAQQEIKSYFTQQQQKPMEDYFFFC